MATTAQLGAHDPRDRAEIAGGISVRSDVSRNPLRLAHFSELLRCGPSMTQHHRMIVSSPSIC
jgi:hypothetical protein